MFFQEFWKVLGLIINKHKISVQFVGVPLHVQGRIINILGFLKGDLLFDTYRSPLSIKRLTIIQCQPLVDRILGRVTRWPSKFLSYLGREQLIKTFLFSIQVYWSQIFILPSNVLKLIASTCRKFLRTGGVEISKKALLA